MGNNRIYYAIQALGIAPHGSGLGAEPSGFTTVHGAQSVGITTNFALDPIFELGQLELYENIEGIPAIEVTIQKVLDGYPLIYHLATPNAQSPTLIGRSNGQAYIAMNIYPDTNDNASGIPITAVGMSGMYISSLKYTLPIDANGTEDVTFVGNNKLWNASGFLSFRPDFDGTDAPIASGGVQRREDVLMGEGDDCSLWPTLIPGITSSGTNPVVGDGFAAHIQSVTVTVDLGRTDLNELGHRMPYAKYPNVPIDVTTAIELTASEGDNVDALADPPSGSNLQDERIVIKLRSGMVIDLGLKNKLASVTFSGGDATGNGVKTTTYNFSNKNSLKVTDPQDPAGLL